MQNSRRDIGSPTATPERTIAKVLAGPFWLRGAIFAVGAWLAMMVIVMPLAGNGLFGLGLGGIATPVAALVLHVVFGLVLGAVYGHLDASLRRTES